MLPSGERRVSVEAEGQNSHTIFELQKAWRDYSLIRAELKTGRTHQIRVHMAHVGHALIGDPVYGGRRKLNAKAVGDVGQAAALDFSRQALHAATLGFVHPVTGEELRFAAPLPQDMADLLVALGGEAPDV